MNYKGHLIGGLVSASIVAPSLYFFSELEPLNIVISSVSVILFALYPDLDIASKPSRYAYMIGVPLIIYLLFIGSLISALMVLLLITVPKMYPHRGFVHTIRFSIIASIFYYSALYDFVNIDKYYIIGSVVIGYMTHLLLDKHIKF